MPDPGRWRMAAPAKLNLWLRVVGRRPDGFHELESVLVLLDLADEVSTDADGPELVVRGTTATDVPTDHTNLAWQGWAAGWGAEPPPGELVVEKRIPVAAGLGGGSSDAAAGWHLALHAAGGSGEQPDRPALASLARIGADVPFFAARTAAARVEGIGERVEPVTDQPDHAEIVLVHPPFRLSTAAVFAELRPGDWSEPVGARLLVPAGNDLLAPARRLRPELDEVFRIVATAGGGPHLTGSGPTVFMTTDDPERAAGVARRVDRAGLATSRTRIRAEPASIEPW
jgi:4-diphosphocytidyl-2-C-methyl-D-erythritol kinase